MKETLMHFATSLLQTCEHQVTKSRPLANINLDAVVDQFVRDNPQLIKQPEQSLHQTTVTFIDQSETGANHIIQVDVESKDDLTPAMAQRRLMRAVSRWGQQTDSGRDYYQFEAPQGLSANTLNSQLSDPALQACLAKEGIAILRVSETKAGDIFNACWDLGDADLRACDIADALDTFIIDEGLLTDAEPEVFQPFSEATIFFTPHPDRHLGAEIRACLTFIGEGNGQIRVVGNIPHGALGEAEGPIMVTLDLVAARAMRHLHQAGLSASPECHIHWPGQQS